MRLSWAQCAVVFESGKDCMVLVKRSGAVGEYGSKVQLDKICFVSTVWDGGLGIGKCPGLDP